MTNSDTVHHLYISYMVHLHKLHPFLDPNDLEKNIEMFIRTYCSSVNNHNGSVDQLRGAKCRRSLFPVADRASPPRIEQSIDNAVILLVLALGSICKCCGCPVPSPVSPGIQGLREERNVDIIPGLAYYGYATQILGSLQGGNDLSHVQAALLAGLYAGQLAHSFQSYGWIFQGTRACQMLV